jgi:hypothetical protein
MCIDTDEQHSADSLNNILQRVRWKELHNMELQSDQFIVQWGGHAYTILVGKHEGRKAL